MASKARLCEINPISRVAIVEVESIEAVTERFKDFLNSIRFIWLLRHLYNFANSQWYICSIVVGYCTPQSKRHSRWYTQNGIGRFLDWSIKRSEDRTLWSRWMLHVQHVSMVMRNLEVNFSFASWPPRSHSKLAWFSDYTLVSADRKLLVTPHGQHLVAVAVDCLPTWNLGFCGSSSFRRTARTIKNDGINLLLAKIVSTSRSAKRWIWFWFFMFFVFALVRVRVPSAWKALNHSDEGQNSVEIGRYSSDGAWTVASWI